MPSSFRALYVLAFLTALHSPLCAEAYKWQGQRQSKNVVDLRAETRLVSQQTKLEEGRRYLIATIMMAEKDVAERSECKALNEELEGLKSVREPLEEMGIAPVSRLACASSAPSSYFNICAHLLGPEGTDPKEAPNLKKFATDLEAAYGPAITKLNELSARLKPQMPALAKEEPKCRAALQLINAKTNELLATYSALTGGILELEAAKPAN